MKRQYRVWLIGVVVLAVIAAVAFTGGNAAGPEQNLALQPPAFVQAASSETSGTPEQIAAMLSDEAGISAYIQTSGPIDLSQVEGEFRTIETQTTEYIVGSVPVPDHPEHFDVHVYVHSDGWILAYYMEDEATSKMVDVRSQTISSTKLETIISNIAGSLGESVADLKYYDFRYPNATNILMVAEDQSNGRNFYIEMPVEYGYSERSFGVYNTFDSRGWNIYINDEAAPRSWYGSNMAYGSISAAQLPAGQSHEISLSSSGNTAYGVLVITYRVP
jgi:hypothetical protein